MSQRDQEPPEDILNKNMAPVTSLSCAYRESLSFEAAGKELWPEERSTIYHSSTWSQ